MVAPKPGFIELDGSDPRVSTLTATCDKRGCCAMSGRTRPGDDAREVQVKRSGVGGFDARSDSSRSELCNDLASRPPLRCR